MMENERNGKSKERQALKYVDAPDPKAGFVHDVNGEHSDSFLPNWGTMMPFVGRQPEPDFGLISYSPADRGAQERIGMPSLDTFRCSV